jgi:hypothetical protein
VSEASTAFQLGAWFGSCQDAARRFQSLARTELRYARADRADGDTRNAEGRLKNAALYRKIASENRARAARTLTDFRRLFNDLDFKA